MLRVIAIWVFGLFASALIGGMIANYFYFSAFEVLVGSPGALYSPPIALVCSIASAAVNAGLFSRICSISARPRGSSALNSFSRSSGIWSGVSVVGVFVFMLIR
jgi:hypothetical protein